MHLVIFSTLSLAKLYGEEIIPGWIEELARQATGKDLSIYTQGWYVCYIPAHRYVLMVYTTPFDDIYYGVLLPKEIADNAKALQLLLTPDVEMYRLEINI